MIFCRSNTRSSFTRIRSDAHARRLNVVAKIAAGATVSTPTVADALLAHLSRLGRNTLPLLIQALPISRIFYGPRQHDEDLAARPYFINCGTIEPRKNQLLTLNIWSDLAQSLGQAIPKLIVAGTRGWETDNIIDMLERCPAIRHHATEASGFSTPSLKRLIDNARAVLVPSFAEGLGLPVAEAPAARTRYWHPDLPSFGAMCGTAMTWLDPLD
jgi:glycosyltransferase involved in cell wall biosynthesis